MSIKDKLDYIKETKELIKEGLNNLGEPVGDYDTFRSYPEIIDDLYNNWPRVTASGEYVSLDQTMEAPLDIDLKGNTSQTGTPTPSSPITVNVVSGDNTITISNDDNTQSQNYSISLGTTELCKIGTYQDYFFKNGSKWYLHKEVGKVVLNGTETYNTNMQSSSVISFKLESYTSIIKKSSPENIISNLIAGVESGFNPNTIRITSTGLIIMNFEPSFCTYSATGIKDKLTTLYSSGSPMIIYFPLDNSTDTEITNTTLINQLEDLRGAMSYEGQTNISQVNNDLPFILSAEALKGSGS